jgi:hypothetical protein
MTKTTKGGGGHIAARHGHAHVVPRHPLKFYRHSYASEPQRRDAPHSFSQLGSNIDIGRRGDRQRLGLGGGEMERAIYSRKQGKKAFQS